MNNVEYKNFLLSVDNLDSSNPKWICNVPLKNKDEYDTAHLICRKSENFWEFSALFIPVRTHNLKDFAKDFFIPTVIRYAIKIDSFLFDGIKFFFCLMLDIVTFPARVITVIPRVIYNIQFPKEKDPFFQFLKSKGVEVDNLLTQDYIKTRFLKYNYENKVFSGEESRYTASFIAMPNRHDIKILSEVSKWQNKGLNEAEVKQIELHYQISLTN